MGAVFMQVFDMSINTILHCYVADKEAHGGNAHFVSAASRLHKISS